MRAILVLPAYKMIVEAEIFTGLKSLQALVCGHIEGVYPDITLPEFEGCHGYVNEEFLYTHPQWKLDPWRLGPYEFLCGPGVFLGSTGAGEEADCPVGLDAFTKHVQWLRPD
jgi:hypothetical protein